MNIQEFIINADNYLSNHPVFIVTLLFTGVFFTIYLGFPQIRYFKKSLKIIGNKNHHKHDGDASHFQALATALSGTVGTGNIAGVALAIHLGGPSALLWMMVTAILGMSTKCAEVTLSHKYREFLPDGTIAGGPMYYMQKRLNIKTKNKEIKIGKIIAIIFALCTIIGAFGTGCLPQINSISSAMKNTFGLEQIICGIILSILLALVILGGIKRIVKVTEKLVPFMAIIYFVSALVVICCNIENFWPGVKSIFCDALTGSAATGGFLGATVSFALTKGVGRGLFSNEAGQGSAPIAHAAAKSKNPADEGLVALLEPFIDTVIICMLTGSMIIASGVWKQKFVNQFQKTDMLILNNNYDNPEEILTLLNNKENTFTGFLEINDGIMSNQLTFVHNRSIAEDVKFYLEDKNYTGKINVENGIPELKIEGKEIKIFGKSLVHSANLTIEAFSNSIFGQFGKYIVAISLLLFAFSTALAWSYYGDRAISFLGGHKLILPFRIVYIIGFFVGSFTDTTIIWSVAGIGIVLMSMPNLIGILILSKEVKSELKKSVLEN